jgi:hypothetical protein
VCFVDSELCVSNFSFSWHHYCDSRHSTNSSSLFALEKKYHPVRADLSCTYYDGTILFGAVSNDVSVQWDLMKSFSSSCSSLSLGSTRYRSS